MTSLFQILGSTGWFSCHSCVSSAWRSTQSELAGGRRPRRWFLGCSSGSSGFSTSQILLFCPGGAEGFHVLSAFQTRWVVKRASGCSVEYHRSPFHHLFRYLFPNVYVGNVHCLVRFVRLLLSGGAGCASVWPAGWSGPSSGVLKKIYIYMRKRTPFDIYLTWHGFSKEGTRSGIVKWMFKSRVVWHVTGRLHILLLVKIFFMNLLKRLFNPKRKPPGLYMLNSWVVKRQQDV